MITTRNRNIVIQADRTPTIGELTPGAVIYRWATVRNMSLLAELPCHADQVANISYNPDTSVPVDRPVVCRRCFTTYTATPVPATEEFAWYRVVYHHTGTITMSRAKRRGE